MTIPTDVKRAIIGAAIDAIGSLLPIKVMGRTFSVPNDQKYIEILLFTDDNANETWGNDQMFSGILRLILHWPIDDQGIYGPSEIMDTLTAKFPKGRIITRNLVRLMINDNPRAQDPIENTNDIEYPATIAYQFFYAPTT
ncbi:hypothetical protein HUU40_00095 [candidate division KSB1 bacterium]|nr:hypothetical protein [candidate division KSB1 bacterium]